MIVHSIRKLAPLIGMSHTALNNHFKAGKFSAEPGGAFDSEKVKVQLKRNRDMQQPSQAKGAKGARPSIEPEDPSHGDYNKARAYREKLRAKQTELDLKQRMGEVLDASEADKAWGEMVTTARNKALMLPSELAPKLALETDLVACEEILRAGVYAMLTELASYQPQYAPNA